MEHRRHLEEYSIRTGDAISVQSHVTIPNSQVAGSWASHLNDNEAFSPDEGPRDTSSRKDVEYGLPSNGALYGHETHSGSYGLHRSDYYSDVTYGGSISNARNKEVLHFL